MSNNNVSEFNSMMRQVNHKIIDGALDESVDLLKEAMNFYDFYDLSCDILNIFDRASNVLEAATKRALFLEQLNRVIQAAKKNNLIHTMAVYYRYYALAQAFYGDPERGLEIISEAEKIVEEDSDLAIELRNAKGLIYSVSKDFDQALKIYLFNYQESQRLHYKPGDRFVHNIGTAYRDLQEYRASIPYFESSIKYDLNAGYILNAVDAMLELADAFYRDHQYEAALDTLRKASAYDALTNNLFLYKSYCELMYLLLKQQKKYKDALEFHETLMSLELQMNMDRYSGMIAEYNMKYDMSEKEKEYAVIKSKNNDLEMMSQKLENMNRFLKATLEKSHAMQESLTKKNEELESTMASLNLTQEKLLMAEKRSVLDQVFINIADHMSTPLGVINTTISHMEHVMKNVQKRFDDNKISKNDLSHCIQENNHSVRLMNESMKKVVGFVDTLRLYKAEDEEKAVTINLKTYFLDLLSKFETLKGVEHFQIKCDDDIELTLNLSLFDKCLDMIADKLLASSCRNGFDIEVSKEINMVSIGFGDFGPCRELDPKPITVSVVDSYDYYIIETIVENLMNGRFIKFEDQGRNYFQFIFHTNS